MQLSCFFKKWLKKRSGSGIASTTLVASVLGFSLPATLSGNSAFDSLSDIDCVVEPSLTIELAAAVPGLLAENFFERGDNVKSGAVLARLESTVERVALAIAEQSADSSTGIELRRLTAEFGDRTRQRNAKLRESVGVSEQEMDQVDTEARIARLRMAQEEETSRLASLEVERARARLYRREIRSPIDGLITSNYKKPGEYVDREPVFQIVQLDPLQVEVIVANEYLGSLSTDTTALITIDAPGFENRRISAEIYRIDAVADAASATFGVQLMMPNADFSIPGGVRCSVDFIMS